MTEIDIDVEIEIETLRRWAVAALLELGAGQAAAEATAASMLHANRRGLDSHGIVLLGVYAARLRGGHIHGDAHPELVSEHGALAFFDGNLAPGAHTGKVAMEWCCETARHHGVGAATIRNSCHFGAASFFSELAADRGCIGLTLTNSDPGMAPLGALTPILGTNPIALAAPRGDGSIMPSLDIATSVVAQGRVAAAARAGEPIPEGWAIGTDGTVTTDAADAMRNAMLPMAGHKGFGLAFMIEVVTACLSGAQISPVMVEEVGVGHLMIALDVAAAAGMETYGQRLEMLIDAVHAARRDPEVAPFMIPGEREHRVARERDGIIPLDAATSRLLDALSAEYGLPPLQARQPT